jgi:hypothetical protein
METTMTKAEALEQLEIERIHNAYDTSRLEAAHRQLMDRIALLLKDAVDAIEIEEPQIALSRIRNVISLTKPETI